MIDFNCDNDAFFSCSPSLSGASDVTWTADGCNELATIIERTPSSSKALMVCGGTGNSGRSGNTIVMWTGSPGYGRERHLYESSSHVVEIRMTNYAALTAKLGRFLIKYEGEISLKRAASLAIESIKCKCSMMSLASQD
jgi:hypothetical protein